MDGFVRGDLWCSTGWCVITSPIDFSHSRRFRRKKALIELQLEMNLLEFLSVCAIVTFVECCAVCLNRLSLHKKVKLCCPMLETINYDSSVRCSRHVTNTDTRTVSTKTIKCLSCCATTRSHAQRNFFFFQLAHPDFSNYDLSIIQKPRAIKKINWKALLRRPIKLLHCDCLHDSHAEKQEIISGAY